MGDLLGAQAIRDLAERVGLRPTKQRGQNFVIDANTVRRIVALSQVTADDVVVEVGPGLGSLTLGLLETGAGVVAIEIEDALAQLLPQTVTDRMPEARDRLAVVNQDALTVTELPQLPHSSSEPTAVVANLPYNVSVPVLVHLLETFPSWQTGLVMVQLEVAERICASPGNKIYGVPSAKIAWFCQTATVGKVPPKVFWPVPNVDSGLVRLQRRDPPVTTATRQQTFRVIDAAFSQRRKMLRAALAGLCGSSAAASAAIEAAGVDPQLRGETLDVQQFADIAAHIFANDNVL